MTESNWRESLAEVKRLQEDASASPFDTDPEVQAMIKAVTEAAAGLQRGHTLTWALVTEVTGLTRQEPRFWHVVNVWRARLRKDKQIETWPENNVGVRLLHHAENIEIVAKKRTQRAVRQSKKVVTAIRNTDAAQLSTHQMRVALALRENADAVIAAAKKKLAKQE